MRTEQLSHIQPDTQAGDPLVEVPLELIEDFSKWNEEMQENLLNFTGEQLRQFYGEEAQTTPEQKGYELPFKTETVYNVGAVGLAIVMTPELFNREIERAALDKVAGNEEEKKVEASTAGLYAQDKSEYQEYVATAQNIIGSLQHGDESGLGAVPGHFQEALSVRMNQRRNELKDGTMTQGEFELECKKMISVACVGLKEKAEGKEA